MSAFLLMFLGFSFALSPVAGFDIQVMRVVIPLVVLAFFAHALGRRNLTLPTGTILFFVSLFYSWIILSLFYSPVPSWTLRKLLFIFSLLPFLFVLSDLMVHKKDAAYGLTKALVGGGAAVAGVGIVQFMAQFLFARESVVAIWSQITPFFLGGTFAESVATFNSWYVHIGGMDLFRAIAFFPDPHIFAFFTGIILPFALALFLITRKKRWIFAAAALLLADIVTFSRGGEVALLAASGIFVVLVIPYATTRIKHFTLTGIIILLFITLISGSFVVERFVSSFDPSDTSASSRVVLWQEAVDVIAAHPLTGVGLGAYARTVNPRADYRRPIYAHNTYLDIAAETGVVGLILFIAMFLAVLRAFWRNRRQPLAQAGIIGISVFAVHGLFDTPIFSVHIFLLLVFLLSLGIFYERTALKK